LSSTSFALGLALLDRWTGVENRLVDPIETCFDPHAGRCRIAGVVKVRNHRYPSIQSDESQPERHVAAEVGLVAVMDRGLRKMLAEPFLRRPAQLSGQTDATGLAGRILHSAASSALLQLELTAGRSGCEAGEGG
jgi:hypothetical protein